MERKRRGYMPYAGTLPMPDTNPELPRRRNIRPQDFNSDPRIEEANRAMSKTKLTRDPETAIRVTAQKMIDTPFRRWDVSLIKDAKKYLSVELINKIISDQQKKKVK